MGPRFGIHTCINQKQRAKPGAQLQLLTSCIMSSIKWLSPSLGVLAPWQVTSWMYMHTSSHFCKLLLLFHAPLCLCTLPVAHPLHPCICATARQRVKCHLLSTHHLINFVGLNPKEIETISSLEEALDTIQCSELSSHPQGK